MTIRRVFATYDWQNAQVADAFRYCPLCRADLVRQVVGQRERMVCPACGYVHFRNPAPTVSVLVVEDGRVLLGQRGGEPERGKWALPSGYIEFDEDFITAAAREVAEETGLQVQVRAILDVHSAFLPPAYHFLTVVLLATPVGGVLSADDDLQTLAWFPLTGPWPAPAVQADLETVAAYARGCLPGIPLEAFSSGEGDASLPR